MSTLMIFITSQPIPPLSSRILMPHTHPSPSSRNPLPLPPPRTTIFTLVSHHIPLPNTFPKTGIFFHTTISLISLQLGRTLIAFLVKRMLFDLHTAPAMPEYAGVFCLEAA